MLKKFLLALFVVSCFLASYAEDNKIEWKDAYKLYLSKKYAEAMDAFEKLAESSTKPDEKFNCYRHAAWMAERLKKYDTAISFMKKAAKITGYACSAQTMEMHFMLSAKKSKELIDMFPVAEILKYPKSRDRSQALCYIGMAQLAQKNIDEAVKAFQLGCENAENDYMKAMSMQKLASIYDTQVHDPKKAIAEYRKITELSSVGLKCDAYSKIARILIRQKKFDEALAEYDKFLAVKKIPAIWKGRGLIAKASLLQNMGEKDEAIKQYKEAIAIKGAPAWVAAHCQKSLKALQAE